MRTQRLTRFALVAVAAIFASAVTAYVITGSPTAIVPAAILDLTAPPEPPTTLEPVDPTTTSGTRPDRAPSATPTPDAATPSAGPSPGTTTPDPTTPGPGPTPTKPTKTVTVPPPSPSPSPSETPGLLDGLRDLLDPSPSPKP